MERTKPHHPLPPEIQQMEPSETVCRFCGVSYLILHEFQQLQDRLRVAEEELARLRDTVQLERLEELRDSHQRLEASTYKLHKELESTRVEMNGVKIELDAAYRSCSRHRKDNTQLKDLLILSRSFLCTSRQDLQDIQKLLPQIHTFWDQCRLQLMQSCCDADAEWTQQVQMRERAQMKVFDLQMQIQALQTQGECRRQSQDKLQDQLQEAEAQLKGLQKEVTALHANLQGSSTERRRLELLVGTKSKETEDLRSRQSQFEKKHNLIHLRLSQELRGKQESLLSFQQRCRSLEEQLCTQGNHQEELAQMHLQAESENRALRDVLQEARQEVVLLKRQSEQVSTTHQATVEKLEQDLREQMAKQVEMEATLERDQAQLELRWKDKELQLREELNMERERNREREKIENKLREQVEVLEGSLGKTQASLKRQEDEMSRNSQQGAVQLDAVRQELNALRQEAVRLEEENMLLQDTVRRECEEREELTAALTSTREQLLELRRNAGSTGSRVTQSKPRLSLPKLPNERNRTALVLGTKEKT